MSNKVDDSLRELKELINRHNNQDEHLKGYMYDSLVYRYQLARFSEADYEAKEKGISIQETRNIAIRDIMRFIQILNEAIGDHD